MTPGEIRTALNVVETRLRSILEPSAAAILREAGAQAEASYRAYEAIRRRPGADPEWGYRIERERPLKFKPVTVHEGRYEVDLFCEVSYKSPTDRPVRQNVGMRVWSLDDAVIFRPSLDAAVLEETMGILGRRVMLRYHFDSADPRQSGPTFHLQSGGNGLDDEFCWLHEAVSVPRLAHPPLDLVLAVEIVARNFFADDGLRAMDDPLVRGAVRGSQTESLTDWYRDCLAAITAGRSVLGMVWRP